MSERRRVPRRGLWVQVLRKLVQFSALFFVVYSALSMYWRNFREAHNSSRIVGLMTNEVWGTLYRWNERVLTWFGDPVEVSDGFLGGPWSATVAGIPLTDPLSAAGMLVRGEVPPTSMLLGVLLPIGLALLLGKVFCSWLCPGRLTFEVASAVRLGLLRLGLPLPALRIPRMGGYVAIAALAFAALGGAGIFHFVLPYLAVSAALHHYILGGTLGAAAAWVAILFAVDLLVAPGQVCRSLCPTGAVLEWLGRSSRLRLAKDETTACPTSCDLCRRACPYGLFPGRQTHRPTCDSCGRCTPICPDGKLHHEVLIPMPTRRPPPPPPSRLDRRTAAVLLGATLLGASLLTPAPSEAHHNKGLPHYGYFDNYPQVPTDETIRIFGRWEVGATLFNFQGLKRETSDTPNDVRFFTYVYDLEKDEAYEGALELSVELNGDEIVRFGRMEPDEETVYRSRVTVPKSGVYHLVLALEGAEEPVTLRLPVRIDIEGDSVNLLWVGGVGGGLALLLGLAAVGRKRRFTPRAATAEDAV